MRRETERKRERERERGGAEAIRVAGVNSLAVPISPHFVHAFEFSFPFLPVYQTKVKELYLSFYLLITEGWVVVFMAFTRDISAT